MIKVNGNKKYYEIEDISLFDFEKFENDFLKLKKDKKLYKKNTNFIIKPFFGYASQYGLMEFYLENDMINKKIHINKSNIENNIEIEIMYNINKIDKIHIFDNNYICIYLNEKIIPRQSFVYYFSKQFVEIINNVLKRR